MSSSDPTPAPRRKKNRRTAAEQEAYRAANPGGTAGPGGTQPPVRVKPPGRRPADVAYAPLMVTAFLGMERSQRTRRPDKTQGKTQGRTH